MRQIKLSKRLKTVASFIKKGSYFADIGSDHAYLPCYVCIQDKTAKAIAGEVNSGPYNSAKKSVESFELSSAISVRLGNGLNVIESDPIDTIVIAGMGGGLITSILEEGESKIKPIERLIAQPNVDARTVRKWMYHNNFPLVAECLIVENNHIYEILIADKDSKDNPYVSNELEKEFLFGPILLKERSPLFLKKWQQEYVQKQRIVEEIEKSNTPDLNKITTFKKELYWIREVLKDNGKIN